MAALSDEHGLDLRSTSKSASVGRIFRKLYAAANDGHEPAVPERPAEVVFRPPSGVTRPSTQAAAEWFDRVANRSSRVPTMGKPRPDVPNAVFAIGTLRIKTGSGGLHSVDAKSFHRADSELELWSADVASYYPSLIHTKGIFPRSYGDLGAEAYRAILNRRLAVKAAMKEATSKAERKRLDVEQYGLKIILNSTFGQFGSPYSTLFDPEAMISVTLSGQIMLVDLIERLQVAGAEVLSVNTDGVFFKTRRQDAEWKKVLEGWQRDTEMVLELEPLDRLLLLKTNIYATRDLKGKIKRKGAGLKGNLDPEKASNSPVINDAVTAAFFNDIPPEVAIAAETRIERFCAVTRASAKVREGVVIDDGDGTEAPLPKIGRWYKAAGSRLRLLHRILSGKETTPAKATGITLAQDITGAGIPHDLDIARYIAEARAVYNSVPGPHRLDPGLIPGRGLARTVADLGLVPHPKDGKGLPPGSLVKDPTFLWDWDRYETVGTLTGPAWGILVLDVDEPVKFATAVDKNSSPLLESRWADLEGCLVSCRGASHPDAVRSGMGRGKLIFRFLAAPDHPLAVMKIEKWKKAYGVEVFYGKGIPSVLGAGPDGTTYQLDGTLGPPPGWLIDLLTSPERPLPSPKGKGRSRRVKEKGGKEDDEGYYGRLFSRADESPASTTPETPQDASGEGDEGFLEDGGGEASEDDLKALLNVLADISPKLNGEVGWRTKDLGGARRIVVGRCPFDHDSGSSSDGDLGAGFNEEGQPWLKCQHTSCTEVPAAARALAAEYLRCQAISLLDETESSPLDLTEIARSILESVDAGKISLEKAPTGSGKSYSLGQVAVARLREDKVTLIATPTVKLCEEMRELIEHLAPEVIDTDVVAQVYGLVVPQPGSDTTVDSEEFDTDAAGHYPIRDHTRIVLCTHAQLARKGFSRFLRGFWTAIAPGDARPAPVLLIDEISALIQGSKFDLPLEHRITTRHDPDGQGGTKIPVRDCPKSNHSGNCGNCIIHRPFGFGYGAWVDYDQFKIRKLVPPQHFDFNKAGDLIKRRGTEGRGHRDRRSRARTARSPAGRGYRVRQRRRRLQGTPARGQDAPIRPDLGL